MKISLSAVEGRALWPALCLLALTLNLRASAATNALTEVVVVFKTHFDIGYTDMASNIVRKYRTTMMDNALAVVDRNRSLPPEQQFTWTLPGWPMTQVLVAGPGQTPERQARVLAALREGRFAVHALPFSTHTELLETEDLVRGLGYATRLARATGQPLHRPFAVAHHGHGGDHGEAVGHIVNAAGDDPAVEGLAVVHLRRSDAVQMRVIIDHAGIRSDAAEEGIVKRPLELIGVFRFAGEQE